MFIIRVLFSLSLSPHRPLARVFLIIVFRGILCDIAVSNGVCTIPFKSYVLRIHNMLVYVVMYDRECVGVQIYGER